ncbi:MAG: DUF2344 domain-containing protein, partial [Deltaproteobacteria bacterium]|nr:DUF2344 domain-containing protein [Deltaproteobacteria bacterium]
RTIEIQNYLMRELKRCGVNFRYHNAFSTFLEGVFARADRSLSKVIVKAYQLGARLEGWTEKLSEELWMAAFDECGIDPHRYLMERDTERALPWDHISCDIPKSYFLKEWKRATASRVTPDCLTQSCSSCGACDYDAVRNELFERTRSETRLNIVDPPWNRIIDARERGALTVEQLTPAAGIGVKRERPGRYDLKEYLRTEHGGGYSEESEALPIRQRVRLRYQKVDSARYFSHFELKSIFFRQLRRCSLPIAFTRGFNPKPKMLFGPPLQLGIASEAEYLDLFLTDSWSTQLLQEVLLHKINSLMPAGLMVLDMQELDLKADAIQNVTTNMRYRAVPLDSQYSRMASELMRDQGRTRLEIEVKKVRKGKESGIRLGKCIENVVVMPDSMSFDMPFSSGIATLKPTEVVSALTNLPSESFDLCKIASTLAA